MDFELLACMLPLAMAAYVHYTTDPYSLALYFHQLILTLTRYMFIPLDHPFCGLLPLLLSLLLSSVQVQ